jgi:hypothetical protein
MSTATRTNRPNPSTPQTKRAFDATRAKVVHVSKPVFANPKFKKDSLINTEAQFIVAPFKGRTYQAPENQP